MNERHLVTALIAIGTLSPSFSARAELGLNELIVEALVDGPAAFHLTPQGVYWENQANAKPGRWNGQD